MRQTIISIIFAVLASTVSAQAGNISIFISEFEKKEGQVAIGLYKNSNGFPEINHAYKSVFLNVTEKNIQYTFSDVPSGDYAIAVFHDSNNDEELNKNFFGIPKEGYGFSKNAASTFGPPHFDKAKFKLENDHSKQSIKLKY